MKAKIDLEKFICSYVKWNNIQDSLKEQGLKCWNGEIVEIENEDEKIRKAQLDYWRSVGGKEWHSVPVQEVIAWLEKQNESDETKAKTFLINKGYPIDANGIFPSYEEMYNIIRDGFEKQGEQKNKISFTFEDVLALECSMKTAKITKGGESLYKILVSLYNKIHNAYLLEKQGEKKPVDKIEPKFHEGDWVVQGDNILKIKCVGDTCYCFETVGGYADDILVSEIDSQFHLWTIEDAKDGDVLTSRRPFIYGKQCPYGGLNWSNNKFIKASNFIFTDSPVHPATKEQRDLLFAKMKKAGYEWDADKKELSKRVIDEGKSEIDYCFTKMMNGEKV